MKKTLENGMPYATDKVGFGIYHFAQGAADGRGIRDTEGFPHDGDDRKQCDYQESLDYMNFYIYRLDENCYDHLRRIKEMGCVTWVYYSPEVKVELNGKRVTCLKWNWQEEITKLVEGVKKAGLWDVVVGFQYDEPLSRMDQDTFEHFTKFMSKFGKRQMAILSVYEFVEGAFPTESDPEFGIEAHMVTPKSCQYLTDVGFDVYKEFDYDYYKDRTDTMIKMMGRDNFYIWHVPTTWTYYGKKDFTEDLCIRSLEGLYKLLLEAKYPGGLFCYNWRSWRSYGSTSSLDYRFHTNSPERWDRLEKRMVEIGKEIREIKLKELPATKEIF